MKDLISRQAAIDAIGNYLKKDGDQIVIADVVDAAVAIGRLPSAQPEIIRCKDCMHNGSYDTDCPIDWNGKEYCSFAERKEDE